MISKHLGFCAIKKDIFSCDELTAINSKLKFRDISIGDINIESPNKVFSVQSIFYGQDISSCSLVQNQKKFENLKILFAELCRKINSLGYKSIIFGSPALRKNKTVNYKEIISRLNDLILTSTRFGLTLYFEALPSIYSDILNSHKELINIQKKIHFDSATFISNGKTLNDLNSILPFIERFHLSVPGYGMNFTDFPILKDIYQELIRNKIKGTIEIQNRKKNENIKKVFELLEIQ